PTERAKAHENAEFKAEENRSTSGVVDRAGRHAGGGRAGADGLRRWEWRAGHESAEEYDGAGTDPEIFRRGNDGEGGTNPLHLHAGRAGADAQRQQSRRAVSRNHYGVLRRQGQAVRKGDVWGTVDTAGSSTDPDRLRRHSHL